MSRLQETVLTVVFAVIYLVAAFMWEKAIARIVVWWVSEFIAARSSLSDLQAIGYILVALFYSFVIIPSFLWFPVVLFKELKYLWDNALDDKPTLI